MRCSPPMRSSACRARTRRRRSRHRPTAASAARHGPRQRRRARRGARARARHAGRGTLRVLRSPTASDAARLAHARSASLQAARPIRGFDRADGGDGKGGALVHGRPILRARGGGILPVGPCPRGCDNAAPVGDPDDPCTNDPRACAPPPTRSPRRIRPASGPNPLLQPWRAVRPAAVRAHRARALRAGVRARDARAPRRDRGDRRATGRADVREHDRRARRARPRSTCASRSCSATSPLPRPRPTCRRSSASCAPRLAAHEQRDPHRRGAVRARRRAARAARHARARRRGAAAARARAPRLHARRRESRRRTRARARRRSSSASRPSRPRSARTCCTTRRRTGSSCTDERDLAGLPAAVRASRARGGAGARAGPRLVRLAVALDRRAVPHLLRRARPARARVPRSGRAAASTPASTTTGRSRARSSRCASSSRGCTASPATPTTRCATAWPARPRRGRRCSSASGSRPGAGAASERDELAALARSRGEPDTIEPWDWRYYAEQLRQRALRHRRGGGEAATSRSTRMIGGDVRLRAGCSAALRAAARPAAYHPDVRTWEVHAARTAHGRACSWATTSAAEQARRRVDELPHPVARPRARRCRSSSTTTTSRRRPPACRRCCRSTTCARCSTSSATACTGCCRT